MDRDSLLSIFTCLDELYDSGKLFSCTLNSVVKGTGLAKGTVYKNFSSVNDFYVLLFNRNLIRWGINGQKDCFTSALNPKEKLLAQIYLTTLKNQYSRVDNDIQYFVSIHGLMDCASHQYIHDTSLIYKKLKSINLASIRCMIERGYVDATEDEIRRCIQTMKNYERGFTLNYDNKNINMFGCEDSLDMMKFEADILQTLNWNITDEISISNVEEYCHSLAPRIVADTDYIEEMKLLSY